MRSPSLPRMNDITSTEKLLDLIRKKKRDLDPAALKVKAPLPARKKIRLAFMNKLAIGKSINVGIDIGHESLRLVKTEKISDNKWVLIDYQTIPLDRQIRKGTPEFINFLKWELSRFCGSYEKINIWAIMSSANVSVRHIRIPKVPKNQIENAVFWMIKKESPFNEKENILDFEVLKESVDEGIPKWFVMAYTAPIRDIEEIKSLFSKIGRSLTGISIVPFAAQNIFRAGWTSTSDDTVAYLFIGNDFSRIDIYSKGNLIMTRGIKAGINSMVEALHEVLQASEKTVPSAIDLDQARKVLFSLSPDSQALEPDDSGYFLTEEEKFRIIRPALERLVRQVERTFEYYASYIGQDKVNRIYVTSAMSVYIPLIEYVGKQLDLQSEILDLFDPELSSFALDERKETVSERVALAPALGMALSDNTYTPNLLVTFREKQETTKIASVNRGIFAVLLLLTLITAGVFLVEIAHISNKKGDISRLQKQLAQYQPHVGQSDLLQMAAKTRQQKYSSQAYGERYLGMAVIGELTTLTPANIRLLNLKADFGVAAIEKARELPKETPQKTAPVEKKESSGEPRKEQAPESKLGNLIVEGIIVGNRMSLESSLAGYLIKLQASPLFRQVTMQKNSVERDKKREVLRFTINMKIASV
jgi:Tfp pilus assembly PilM family ATPase